MQIFQFLERKIWVENLVSLLHVFTLYIDALTSSNIQMEASETILKSTILMRCHLVWFSRCLDHINEFALKTDFLQTVYVACGLKKFNLIEIYLHGNNNFRKSCSNNLLKHNRPQ